MRRSLVKNMLNWFVNMVLIVSAACVFLFGGNFLPQVSLVNGHSMLPTFQSGDAVLTVKAATYHPGDIIVYHPENLPCDACNVVHRIIGSEQLAGQTHYITKGDNNPNSDPWRPTLNEIKGKVVFFLPIRGAAQILYYPQFWLMLIGLTGVVIFGLRLRGLLGHKVIPETSPVGIEPQLAPVPQAVFFDLDAVYTKRTNHLPFSLVTDTLDKVYATRVASA